MECISIWLMTLMLKARKEIFLVCYTMLNIAVAAATSRLQSSDT